jgi:hypothetical protein
VRSLCLDHADAVELFDTQMRELLEAAQRLDDLALLGASLCHGWSRVDVLVHVRLGLEEVLGGCVAQTDRPVDHDAASYWASFAGDTGTDPVPPMLWLRRTAAAYGRPSSATRHLADVMARVRGALYRMPDHPVLFQDKVMTSGDFLATWVVELAIHQLDLDLADASTPVGLALARQTVEALADEDLPPELDDRAAVLAALGRAPVPDDLHGAFPIAL